MSYPKNINYLAYTLLLLPPILSAVLYRSLLTFPSPRALTTPTNSLASLPKSAASWRVYPEEFFPGGAYVDLPAGRTRYWVFGPEEGKKIVLIHGLSVPAVIWKRIAPELAARGMRVLVYDLFGRGWSDAPAGPYDTSLYTTQLALVMQHIKWTNGADVVMGLSMGGGITTAFTKQFPHLVGDKVVLLASTGVLQIDKLPATLKIMSSPLVQTLLSGPTMARLIQFSTGQTNNADKSAVEVGDVPEIVRLQSAHLPRYNAALASSLRDGPVRGLERIFTEDETWSGKSVLLIHGNEDDSVEYKHTSSYMLGSLTEVFKRVKGSVKLVTVEGGDHDLTLSRPKEVLNALVPFIGL